MSINQTDSIGSSSWLQRTALLCGVLLSAVAIVHGSWLTLGVLFAVPFVLLFPVVGALGMFALFVPFDRVILLDSQTGSLASYVGVAAGAILLFAGLAGRRFHFPPRAAWLWAMFAGWCVMTMLWAEESEPPKLLLTTVAMLVILYFVTASIRISRVELDRIGQFVILGGSVASAYVVLQFTQGHTILGGRAAMALGDQQANPNEFAASLLLPISLGIGAFLGSRKIHGRVAALAALAVTAFALLLTMSRGSFLAVGVMVLVYIARLGVDRRILIALGVLVALGFALPTLFYERLSDVFVSRGQGRLDIWYVGWEVLKHNALLGVGLANFPAAYSQYAGSAPVFRGLARAPHNIYLEVWAEMGIVGMMLFIFALRAQFQSLYRAMDKVSGSARSYLVAYEAAAWGLLVHAFVANLLWRKSLWMCWALMTVAAQVSQSEDAREIVGWQGPLQKIRGRDNLALGSNAGVWR